MNKRALVAIPVVAGLVLTTWVLTRDDGAEQDLLAASGTVEATEADLGFPVGGRLAEVLVFEGDPVSGGQELARLEVSELDAMRAGAAAQVAASEARLDELVRGARPEEVAQAESALRAASERADDARRDAERTTRLFDGGAVSRQTLDKAETARQVAEAAFDQATQALTLVRQGARAEIVRAQRAAVDAARANLARSDASLDHAVVRAPFPGRVSVRHREPGETVGPGAPVLTLLDPSSRWVRIYVREDAIGRVRIGMGARISSDTYPERSYDGEVVFIGSEAEFTPRNVQTAEERIRLVYPVKVRILGDPDFELKPGIPADVTLLEPAP